MHLNTKPNAIQGTNTYDLEKFFPTKKLKNQGDINDSVNARQIISIK